MTTPRPPLSDRDGQAQGGRLIDGTALARLANLQLRVRAVVDGAMAGLHRSSHHGASVEFAEHKEYSPGDDPRRLDWKAYAKFDRYFIRQHENETELKAYLLLDCSGSMDYGEPLTKLAYGAVMAGALACLLVRQGDQVGVATFADGVRTYVPPRARGGHLAHVLSELERVSAAGTTDLERTVTQLVERIGRRALVVVISDLFDDGGNGLRRLRQLRARHHEVVVLQLLHQDELEFPFTELSIFEALERDARLLVDPAAVRHAYLREVAQFVAQTEINCREGEISYQLVSTAQSPVDALLRFLFSRRGRR